MSYRGGGPPDDGYYGSGGRSSQGPPPGPGGGRGGGGSGGSGTSPVYQIDFTAVACGKRIANTKRRVRWRFGFTNRDALDAGETGTACRGEEHDITLVWSITSGKRLILADGQEVHYSNSRSSILDFSWTMRGNHVLKVVAHASPPIGAGQGFRQYDFFVDGRSFFNMPKVYRLGLTGGRGGGGGGGGSASRARGGDNGYAIRPVKSDSVQALEEPHNPDEEEAYLAEAIKQSLEEKDKKPPEQKPLAIEAAPAPAPAQEDNLLLDFFDAPAPAPAPLPALPAPAPAAVAATPYGGTAPQPTFSDISAEFPGAAPPAPAAPFASPPPPAPAFAQPPAAPAAATAAPAFAYGASMTAPPPAAGAAPMYQQPPPTPADPFGATAPTPAAAPPVAAAPAGSLTMGSLYGAPKTPAEAAASADGPGSMADKAYRSLADNFDLTSNPTSTATTAAAVNPFGSSMTAAPASAPMGAGGPKQPVMNAPPPGALVVSGVQSGNWGVGGGVAAGGGYGQPQMAPPAWQQQQPYGAPQQQPQMQQQPPMYQQGGNMYQQPPPQQQQQQQQYPPPLPAQNYGYQQPY